MNKESLYAKFALEDTLKHKDIPFDRIIAHDNGHFTITFQQPLLNYDKFNDWCSNIEKALGDADIIEQHNKNQLWTMRVYW